MVKKDRLPLPKAMGAVERARTELPVGGAPPIKDLPRFDKMPPPSAMPRAAEKQMPQREPPRSPEEIKADFERAAEMLSKGDVRATNRPEEARSLQDTTIPSQVAWKPQASQEPQQEEAPAEEGPTFGELSDFDWESYHTEQKNSDFRAPEIRTAIQARSPEVEIEDLILYESVEQRQVIIPGKLEVVFRTLTASEDVAIKDYIYRMVGGTRYVVDMLTLITLTCGLKTFNDVDLPDHMKLEAGERVWDDERLEAKMKVVKNLGIQLVSLLSITYFWFDQSVRKKLVAGVLGKL